jgi:hypothetical protein
MKAHLILVTGSRAVPQYPWTDIVYEGLGAYKSDEFDYRFLMHGMCRHPGFQDGGWKASVDMLADEWARESDIPVMPFPAHWNYGYKAGPERNRLMVDTVVGMRSAGWTTQVCAFHPNLSKSTGTLNCVRYAQMNGLIVDLHDGERIWTLGLENPPYLTAL